MSEWVSDKQSQWSDSGPIKTFKSCRILKCLMKRNIQRLVAVLTHVWEEVRESLLSSPCHNHPHLHFLSSHCLFHLPLYFKVSIIIEKRKINYNSNLPDIARSWHPSTQRVVATQPVFFPLQAEKDIRCLLKSENDLIYFDDGLHFIFWNVTFGFPH